MTRIKYCGMTRVSDALLAARLGVDAIGLVFTVRSRRQVSVEQARVIRCALPPFISCVALFMDDDKALVDNVITIVRPDLLQFHGRESAPWCASFGLPWIKAIAMGDVPAALTDLRCYPRAAGLLLDGHHLGEAGGSGKCFDWAWVPSDLAQPLILAGGLHAGNVGAAIHQLRPWAVDVASGVESAPGIKDADRMTAFVASVRRADKTN